MEITRCEDCLCITCESFSCYCFCKTETEMCIGVFVNNCDHYKEKSK